MFSVTSKQLLSSVSTRAGFINMRLSSARAYSSVGPEDKFNERERASEDMYIRKEEQEKIKALRERLDKAAEEMQQIQDALKDIAPKK
ncbi:ATPase inhibitor, mitochondrial [Smittium mucronatum]|uniref:ATPase inhibitor, mitochondrial n=1 Tax=Smittium mucronatum TaxID=133383 RepID=A0A1R0H599_9FUNG|nr:ATPase inhibitor, mitochondrial [Smittium mucronatum]